MPQMFTSHSALYNYIKEDCVEDEKSKQHNINNIKKYYTE